MFVILRDIQVQIQFGAGGRLSFALCIAIWGNLFLIDFVLVILVGYGCHFRIVGVFPMMDGFLFLRCFVKVIASWVGDV